MADFAALYMELDNNLRKYTYYHTKADPDNLAGSIWLKALEADARGNGPRAGEEIHWLRKVARNKLLEHYRAESRTPEHLPEERGYSIPSGERMLAHVENCEYLRQLLAEAKLTHIQREVLELRLAGFTFPEIARYKRSKLHSVKSLQNRAFQKIRALFQEGS